MRHMLIRPTVYLSETPSTLLILDLSGPCLGRLKLTTSKCTPKLTVDTKIFDQSGSLPFTVVFGLCRRSSEDTNPRSLILDTSGSVFDVQYALANRLLKLFEGDPTRGEELEIDLSSFNAEPGPHQYVYLPPPKARTGHWTTYCESFLYEIDIKSDLARLLKPNTKYSIRLASKALAVQCWRYTELGKTELPSDLILYSKIVSEPVELVSHSENSGKAVFTSQTSLPSPPELDIHLRLQPQPPDEASSQESTCTLEFSITNTDPEHPVSIQSTGRQSFLSQWGPFNPSQILDHRPRLTSTRHALSCSGYAKCNLIIYSVSDDAERKSIFHRTKSPICCLHDRNTDLRPKRKDFTTLWPGKPQLQRFDLVDLLIADLKLPDGTHLIELEELGAWWCWGSVDEIFDGVSDVGKRIEEEKEKEEENIPKEKYIGSELRPPVWLRSKDSVVVMIMGQEIVGR